MLCSPLSSRRSREAVFRPARLEFSSFYGPLCNVPVDSSGAATCTTGLLPVGDNLVRVSYYGDQNDSPITQTTVETIKGVPTTSTIAGSQTSVLYGTPVTLAAAVTANIGGGVPTGVVIFSVTCSNANDGFVSLDSAGHATCVTSPDVSVGLHNVSFIYTGDENYAQSTSNTVPLTIQPLGVTPTPTLNPSGGTYNQTFFATIADANTNAAIYYTTDGSVPSMQFGTLYVGPIAVNQTETISAMAIVPGYTNSNVSSAAYNLPPTFSLGLAPLALSLSAGQTATANVTVFSEFGFNGQVSFSCSGAPAGTTCSFSPAALTANPQQMVTTTMTISGGKASALLQTVPSPWRPLTSLAMAGFTFGLLGLRRRRTRWFMLVVLSSGLVLVSACGGGASGSSNHTSITAAVTVTGSSGSIQRSANLTVTYTP